MGRCPSFHRGPLEESEEVKTIHNEKASTFHETLEVGVKDADNEVIHQVAFGLSPDEKYSKTAIVEYTKKLPQHTKEKLLRKITKKDPYIRTLGYAFRQAKDIDRESSFVDAAAGRYAEQNATKIDTQNNELDNSFQDCDINAVSTRSTNRLTDRSFNGSFDRSSSTNSSHNSSFNSRPNFRNNSYSGDNNQLQQRQQKYRLPIK